VISDGLSEVVTDDNYCALNVRVLWGVLCLWCVMVECLLCENTYALAIW